MTTPRDQMVAELADHLHRVLVVVGSGVSVAATRNAACASWIGLLKHGVAHCTDQWGTGLPPSWKAIREAQLTAQDSNELVSAATEVTGALKRMQEGAYGEWLRSSVGSLTLSDRRLIEAIRSLGAQIATTNYDDLLEQVTGQGSLTWREEQAAMRFLREEGDELLHLHGHWRHPETVVLGAASYEDILRSANPQAMLRASLMTRTLVFVGCGDGMNDPNFGMLFKWSREALRHSAHVHFRLGLRSEQASVEADQAGTPLRFVPYGDSYGDLPGFLEGIAQEAAGRRAALGDSLQRLLHAESLFGTKLDVLGDETGLEASGLFTEAFRLAGSLAEAGGRKSAWISVSRLYKKKKEELGPDLRADVAARLAEMMLGTGSAERALEVAAQAEAALQGDEPLSTKARLARAKARAFAELCMFDEAVKAIQQAILAEPGMEAAILEAERDEMRFFQAIQEGCDEPDPNREEP